MMILGCAGGAAAHFLFTSLLRLIALVRHGDPFVAAAARHVERIGWALLAVQLLDLLGGAVTWRVHAMGAAVLDWQPGDILRFVEGEER